MQLLIKHTFVIAPHISNNQPWNQRGLRSFIQGVSVVELDVMENKKLPTASQEGTKIFCWSAKRQRFKIQLEEWRCSVGGDGVILQPGKLHVQFLDVGQCSTSVTAFTEIVGTYQEIRVQQGKSLRHSDGGNKEPVHGTQQRNGSLVYASSSLCS